MNKLLGIVYRLQHRSKHTLPNHRVHYGKTESLYFTISCDQTYTLKAHWNLKHISNFITFWWDCNFNHIIASVEENTNLLQMGVNIRMRRYSVCFDVLHFFTRHMNLSSSINISTFRLPASHLHREQQKHKVSLWLTCTYPQTTQTEIAYDKYCAIYWKQKSNSRHISVNNSK